jgi:hypothetical protein
MSIFREPFKDEIKNQLEHRQNMMTDYSTQNIQYLNSRNSWIRMTSSVNVGGTSALARQYVLQGGTLQDGAPNVSAPYSGSLRRGIGSGGQSYSTSNFSGNTNRLGIRPMAGITSIDIKSKSAYGSLREITVNFQCWDIKQLEDLELLYMRPGYTVLVEWGWLPYVTSNGTYHSSFYDFYGDDIIIAGPTERTKIFKDLFDRCIKYEGNYDAMFGYIKNYSWKAREDGGYDCQTIVISTGELIESLKVNYIRSNLSALPMYQKGNIGNGYLDSLFASQGTTPSYVYTDAYEKNILAGIWTELDYKLREVTLSPAGAFLNSSYAFPNFPGLSNIGDSSTMIMPGNPYQSYITLGAAIKMINDFVIIKGGASGSQNDPLITLSTKYQGYTNGPLSGSALLCTAHPLQISTDPTICLIPNDTWNNLILPAASASAASAPITSVKSQADSITNEIAASLKNTAGGGYTGPSQYTSLDNFEISINKITSKLLFSFINENFTQNSYNGGENGPYGTSNTYGTGLAGLLTQEFTNRNGSLGYNYYYNAAGYNVENTFSAEIRNAYYLGFSSRQLGAIGIKSKVTLSVTQAITVGSKSYGVGDVVDLEDLLTAAGVAGGYTIEQLATIMSPNFISTYVDDHGLLSIGRGAGHAPTNSWPIKRHIKNYDDPSCKHFETINIVITPDPASSISFIFNINDAIKAMDEIERVCTTPYFYKDDVNTELGVIENIYVNLDFLYKQSLNTNLESQDSKEKNEINLYNYLKSIISGINSALGSVSNLEIHVDPIDNVARIIDINYTDPDRNPNLFELQVQNQRSVVRSYQLNSQIFPNQSSIIAIGAQGGKGGQMGIQNNTMIDFNKQITDRIMPVKGEDLTATSGGASATSPTLGNYLGDIIILLAILNQPALSDTSLYWNASNKAKNSSRDSIVYFQNLVYSSSANRNIIPTKFSFEMDGIGGLVIGQLFTINQDVLPRGYKGLPTDPGSKLAQIVTGIGHKIGGGDWTTTIDALNVILDTQAGQWSTIQNLPTIIKDAITRIIERYK